MKHVGKKSRWGIYVKYFDRSEYTYWYKSEFKRDRALKKFIKETGPDKIIWTALKCSD